MRFMVASGIGVLVAIQACGSDTAEDDGGATSSSRSVASATANTVGQGGAAVGGGGASATGAGGQGGTGGGAPCSGEIDAAACYACCAGAFPAGEQILLSSFGGCGCSPSTCYPECIPWVCGNSGDPDNACVACIEQATAMNGGCGMDGEFQTACIQVSDCADLLACINACTP